MQNISGIPFFVVASYHFFLKLIMNSHYFVIKFEKCHHNIELLGLLITYYGLLRITFIYFRYIMGFFLGIVVIFFIELWVWLIFRTLIYSVFYHNMAYLSKE